MKTDFTFTIEKDDIKIILTEAEIEDLYSRLEKVLKKKQPHICSPFSFPFYKPDPNAGCWTTTIPCADEHIKIT